MRASISRFSDRVENYVRYRPSYPPESMTFLEEACGLTPGSIVADLGSGPGNLTRLFLDYGARVFAVEPNPGMRAAAERAFVGNPLFVSIDATAEESQLPGESVDFIVAGQAFHWFDRERAKGEFRRILRPGGWIALFWNERELESTPFLRAYEAFLHEHGRDYAAVNHRNTDENILREFFAPGEFRLRDFRNRQAFDFAGLKGRCLSSSYMPGEADRGCEAMLAELRTIFDRHQSGGKVEFLYRTLVYYGQPGV